MFTAHHRIVRHGFTLVELLVVMGMFAILASLGSITILNSQNRATSSSTIDSLITDIRQQQLKAMVGDRTVNNTATTGVYFQPGSYTLFQAASYSPNDPGNFVVTLPSVLQFMTINLHGSAIVFAPVSGAIVGYSPTNNTVTLGNTSAGEQKVITFNKYGVITNVQ